VEVILMWRRRWWRLRCGDGDGDGDGSSRGSSSSSVCILLVVGGGNDVSVWLSPHAMTSGTKAPPGTSKSKSSRSVTCRLSSNSIQFNCTSINQLSRWLFALLWTSAAVGFNNAAPNESSGYPRRIGNCISVLPSLRRRSRSRALRSIMCLSSASDQ
jgi:hypothetical protein